MSGSKVAIDLSALDPAFKAHAHRGTGRYVSELFKELSLQSTDIVKFNHRDLIRRGSLDSLVSFLPAGRQTIRQQLLYPFQVSEKNLSGARVAHFPAHVDAPAWAKTKVIVTVLDLIPLIFQDLYGGKGNLRFKFGRWLELQAIKNASKILCISRSTANDVQRLLGVDPKKISVTPLGVSDQFFSIVNDSDSEGNFSELKLLASPKTRPVVLYVGGIDQRKNVFKLLEAFKILITICRDKELRLPQLVLAGKIENEESYPALLSAIKQLELKDHLTLTGFLSDTELRVLLSLASCFVFPSLYEGFGLPVLEAMAAGVPVVASNTSSIPEILSGTGTLIDPSSSRAIAEAVFLTLSERQNAFQLAEQAKIRARNFSWKETARLTLEAYHEVLAV